MHIANIRAGSATNSSSSHSVILVRSDKYPNGVDHLAEPNCDDLAYGWEWFLLTDLESKTKYFAAQLASNVKAIFGHSDVGAACKLIQDITGLNMYDRLVECSWTQEMFIDASVDHQSVWNMNGYDPTDPDTIDFLRDLFAYICRQDVVIQGGNDNDDSEDLVVGERPAGVELACNADGRGHRRIRRDGDWYTVFNSQSGNKMRMSFLDDPGEYVKASAPELVDVKITDYCPLGCSFCYQSSTKEGVHAPLGEIRRLARLLNKLKVFEVAIGGGEPTMHPDFPEILRTFKKYGIQPNFTTYSSAWIKNSDIMAAVNECQPAIGVSVHNQRDLKKLKTINDAINYSSFFEPKVMAQHVVGSLDSGQTCQLLIDTWEMKIPVLLLGFKTVGFGSDKEPHDMKGLGDLLVLAAKGDKKYYGASMVSLSVDTAFLDRYNDILVNMGVRHELTASPEGKFSMYVDAVTGRVGPSSYVPGDELVPLKTRSVRELLSHWRKW